MRTGKFRTVKYLKFSQHHVLVRMSIRTIGVVFSFIICYHFIFIMLNSFFIGFLMLGVCLTQGFWGIIVE